MKMQLTPAQVQQLRPYFERCAATNAIGERGMLVAQLRFDALTGEGTLEPGFLRHEYAKLLEERAERYAIAPPLPDDSGGDA